MREHQTEWEANEHLAKRVEHLRAGDRVDFEGDRFADPRSDIPVYEFEYVVVECVERETPNCMRVDFTNGNVSVGFPPEHVVRVRKPCTP